MVGLCLSCLVGPLSRFAFSWSLHGCLRGPFVLRFTNDEKIGIYFLNFQSGWGGGVYPLVVDNGFYFSKRAYLLFRVKYVPTTDNWAYFFLTVSLCIVTLENTSCSNKTSCVEALEGFLTSLVISPIGIRMAFFLLGFRYFTVSGESRTNYYAIIVKDLPFFLSHFRKRNFTIKGVRFFWTVSFCIASFPTNQGV